VRDDFRVDRWLVQPNLNTISYNGTTVRLEPKVMSVLVCLASAPGETLPKDQLLKRVWADTFVTDDVLIRSISELRRVFADDARAPRFIQTIAKRGYRLVAPVGPADRNSISTAPVTPVLSQAKWLALAAPLIALAVLSTSGLRNTLGRSRTAETFAPSLERRAQNILSDELVKKRPSRITPTDPGLKQAHISVSLENDQNFSTNGDVGYALASQERFRAETLIQNVPPEVATKRVTHAVLPAYPEFAKQGRITGTVEIGLGITPRGDVGNARVLIGHPVLVTPALEAIRQWQFQPNLVQGQPTWSRMRALVRFSADGTTAVDFAPPLLADSFGDPGAPRDGPREAATPPIVPEDR